MISNTLTSLTRLLNLLSSQPPGHLDAVVGVPTTPVLPATSSAMAQPELYLLHYIF